MKIFHEMHLAVNKNLLQKNRSTGVDFEIYRSGRVEKILTDSISVLNHSLADVAYTTEIVHLEFRSYVRNPTDYNNWYYSVSN